MSQETNNNGVFSWGRFRFFAGDKVLWVILAVLAVISVLVVYSSSAKMGYSAATSATATDFLRKQLIFAGISLVCLLAVHNINCRGYWRWAWVFYWVCIALTIYPYLRGLTTNNAARWIQIGPFQFQPSEALKVATVLLLSRQLASRQAVIAKLKLIPSLNPVKWLRDKTCRKVITEHTVYVLGPVVLACMVILPAHTSSALLVFLVSLIMMYIGRVRKRELMKILFFALLAWGAMSMFQLGRSDVAGGRFSTWIQTWTESRMDVRAQDLTDTERSMIAMHEGGLFGKGAGHSAVRVELTHPECDYTFAFFVEEYGLFMALIVMSFYMWITVRGIVIFTRCETAFPGLLVLGLVLLITIQALLHIFVAVNFFPETGQNLPFVSKGGTSMIFSAIAMGIVLSVSRQNDEKSHVAPRAESIMERQ